MYLSTARGHGLFFTQFLLSFKFHEYWGGHPCFHEKRIPNFFDQSDYFPETCVDQHMNISTYNFVMVH